MGKIEKSFSLTFNTAGVFSTTSSVANVKKLNFFKGFELLNNTIQQYKIGLGVPWQI